MCLFLLVCCRVQKAVQAKPTTSTQHTRVKGHKRYVIQPPSACEDLELLGPGDPSSRHASFDWADPQERQKRQNEKFCKTPATEIVLSERQVLYLPSYWFHYIVSLGMYARETDVPSAGQLNLLVRQFPFFSLTSRNLLPPPSPP